MSVPASVTTFDLDGREGLGLAHCPRRGRRHQSLPDAGGIPACSRECGYEAFHQPKTRPDLKCSLCERPFTVTNCPIFEDRKMAFGDILTPSRCSRMAPNRYPNKRIANTNHRGVFEAQPGLHGWHVRPAKWGSWRHPDSVLAFRMGWAG
jgi:hypothetical protein